MDLESWHSANGIASGGEKFYLLMDLSYKAPMKRISICFLIMYIFFINLEFYFSRLIKIFCYSSDQPCNVILCLLRLSHLKRQDSAVVPGINDEMTSQLYFELWMSAISISSFSQCLHMIQIKIFKSQILQFLLYFLVFIILL